MSHSYARIPSSLLRLALVLIVALASHPAWGASVRSLAVTPPLSAIMVGGHQILHAKATLSDGTARDVTGSAAWASSNPAVATISGGSVVGVQPGTTVLTATYQGHSAKAMLLVAAVRSVKIVPQAIPLAVGQSYQVKALATLTNGATLDITAMATWTSGHASVARVSAGKVTGVSAGQSVVTAAWSGQSGTAAVSVAPAQLQRIAITPQNPAIAKGTNQQFKAIGAYTGGMTKDITRAVTWTSSQTGIARIASTGLATGAGVGTTTIRAALGQVSAGTTLTVRAAALKQVRVAPNSAAVTRGATQQFTASGVYTDGSTRALTSGVVWSSSNANIASVDATSGIATGQASGTATITATVNHISGNASLTVNVAQLQSIAVTPANGAVALGTTQQFKAVGTYSDGGTKDISTLVNWSTSNSGIASINAQGLASTLGAGAVTVTAADPSSTIQGSTGFTVTAAQIASIVVTPAMATVPLGDIQQYTATATMTDGTTQDVTTTVNWSSSSTTVQIARVSTSGLATTLAVGQSGILASANNGAHGSAVLNVQAAQLASIAVSPANPSVAAGLTQQLTAQGTYTDGSTQDLSQQVTWSSQDPAIATVDAASGMATGVATGATTLVATSNSTQTIQGTVQLQVTAAQLTGITVSPSAGTAVAGTTLQFTAQGTYTDGTTPDITGQVMWSTSDSTLASVSNSAGSNGIASALKAGGPVTVTATLGSVSNTAQLTVTQPALVSIAVTPAGATIPQGKTQQYTATGTFGDGSTQDITNSVNWSSNQTSVATISNADGSRGLASTTILGPGGITADMNGISGTTTLTVGDPAITSLTLTAYALTFGPTPIENFAFSAYAHYTNHQVSDVSNITSWASSNPAVAYWYIGYIVDGTAAGTSTLTASITDAYGSTFAASALMTNARAPGAPAILSAVGDTGSGIVTVMWTPANAVDQIDSYHVAFIEYNSNTTGRVDAALDVPGNQTSLVTTGHLLIYGVQYQVVVTAINPWGSSSSAPSAPFTYVYHGAPCVPSPLSSSKPNKRLGAGVTPYCSF